MQEKKIRLKWDRLAPDWWSSSCGSIRLDPITITWTAYLHRNIRIGKGWTELKKGFRTSDRAKRWIEREAED